MEDETIVELYKEQRERVMGQLAVVSCYMVRLTLGNIQPGPYAFETALVALDNIALECETLPTESAKEGAEYQILFFKKMLGAHGVDEEGNIYDPSKR